MNDAKDQSLRMCCIRHVLDNNRSGGKLPADELLKEAQKIYDWIMDRKSS